MDPIQATTINSSVKMISSKEKAVLIIKVSAKEKGGQKSVLCKIDSGAETNIDKLYPNKNKLMKPTVILTTYVGIEIPSLGLCKVCVQGRNNPTPRQIKVEVVMLMG